VTHFTQGSLALFVVVYLILMSVGAGVAIPGGLFMPSLIVSQAWDGVLLVQGGTSSDILGAVGVLYTKQRQRAGMIFAPGRAVCLHALRGLCCHGAAGWSCLGRLMGLHPAQLDPNLEHPARSVWRHGWSQRASRSVQASVLRR
jgi:hypothetical protein